MTFSGHDDSTVNIVLGLLLLLLLLSNRYVTYGFLLVFYSNFIPETHCF